MREPFRHAVVTVGDAQLPPLTRILAWAAAIRQVPYADAPRVGGVKSFHERAGQRSCVSRVAAPRGIVQEFRERPVGLLGVEMPHDRVQSLPEILETGQASAARTPSLTFDGVEEESGIASDREQLRRTAVNEFRAQLDGVRDTRVADRVNAPSDAGTRLDHAGANSPLLEDTHRSQAGDAAPDDGNVTRETGHVFVTCAIRGSHFCEII